MNNPGGGARGIKSRTVGYEPVKRTFSSSMCGPLASSDDPHIQPAIYKKIGFELVDQKKAKNPWNEHDMFFLVREVKAM